MGGGDVEGVFEGNGAPTRLEEVLRTADEVYQGVEFAHSHSIVHRD